MNQEQENKLAVFQDKKIRRIWQNDEWCFAIVDIIAVLTESKNPAVYWRVLKKRLKDEGSEESVTNCNALKLQSKDGKMRNTDCANTQTLFRLIQSIPSPKAEPFKKWLAKVGYERIQEIENPELAAHRARNYYKELGYNDDWIAKRLQSIEIRGKLTDEWKSRDVKEGKEYAILTAEIFKAAFGLTPSKHKELKDLKRENLRDHMSDLELIFTMLAETATKNKAVEKDAQGFGGNKHAAIEGGRASGKALEAFEKETGGKVVTAKNFKHQISEAKKEKRLAAKKGKDEKE